MEEQQQDTSFAATTIPPKTGLKWSGILWISGIAVLACMLLIAFILSCYAVSRVGDTSMSASGPPPPTGGGGTLAGKGIFEIQVQYYVPGNPITQFTTTATVGSYEYWVYTTNFHVLKFSPFSYVFNKVSPAASQVTFSLVNLRPPLPQFAALHGLSLLTGTPFRVTGGGVSLDQTYYSVDVGKNVQVSFLPIVIASVTTPYTLTVDREISFVIGVSPP